MRNFILFVCLISLHTGHALSKDMPSMTPDQRVKMAEAHETMAACLRSDRLIKDCKQTMMKHHKEHKTKNGSSMMGNDMMENED